MSTGNQEYIRDMNRAGSRFPELLILFAEFRKALFFVVEHLDDFLSGDQLLNITVQFSEAVLLLRIITLAALSAELDIPEHDTVAHRYNQREPPVQDIQQGQCSHNLDEALDNHRKTVVQGICHRVDIVREKTHDIAVASAVEELQRQCLDVFEQIAADIKDNLLCCFYHGLRVAVCCECAAPENECRNQHAAQQCVHISVRQSVDNRADHIRSKEVGSRADCYQYRYDCEHFFVSSQIRQEDAQRVFQVLWFLSAISSRCHFRLLLSSVRRKFPDKSGHPPAVQRACRSGVLSRHQE